MHGVANERLEARVIAKRLQRREAVGDRAADGVVHEHDEAHGLGGGEVHADLDRRHEGRDDQDVRVLQCELAGRDDEQGQRGRAPPSPVVLPGRRVDGGLETPGDEQGLHQRRRPGRDHGRAGSGARHRSAGREGARHPWPRAAAAGEARRAGAGRPPSIRVHALCRPAPRSARTGVRIRAQGTPAAGRGHGGGRLRAR